jgi:hypothetical protein
MQEHNEERPLSLRQEARLRTNGLEEGHQVVCAAFDVHGPLEVEHLQRALQELAARHEVFRMRLAAAGTDGYVGRVASDTSIPVKVQEVAPERAADLGALAADASGAEQRTPFDLSTGPLLRATVVRLDPARQLLLIVTEHLIADGLSIQILCEELGAAYEALRDAKPWRPVAQPRQFPDYAVWQRDLLGGEEREEFVSYWVEALGGEIPRLRIGDRDGEDPAETLGVMQPTPKPLLEGHYAASDVSAETASRALELCRERRLTPFMLGAAAMAVMLCEATRQREAFMLCPFAARPPEFSEVIGDFSTPLPLRIGVEPGGSALSLLETVRLATLDAMENEQLPYPELNNVVKNNALPYNRIAYFGANSALTLTLSGTRVTTIDPPITNTLFDLSCWLTSRGDQLSVATLHRASWFTPDAAQRWHDSYLRVLADIVGQPEQPIASLSAANSGDN